MDFFYFSNLVRKAHQVALYITIAAYAHYPDTLFIDAVSANEDMILEVKITIEDWYVEDEFDNENVKILDNVRLTLYWWFD